MKVMKSCTKVYHNLLDIENIPIYSGCLDPISGFRNLGPILVLTKLTILGKYELQIWTHGKGLNIGRS